MTARTGRFALASVASLLAALGAIAAQTQTPPQTPQRPPVFRAGAVLVTVDAYPQRDGRLVEGLTAADFQVFEDGKPQTLEGAEFVRIEPGLSEAERRDPNNTREMWDLAADPHNRVFVVYLDHLHVTVDGSHSIRRPLIDTLNQIIAPNDLFGVMTPILQPRHLVLGRRLQSLEDQLGRYWAWGERNRITPDMNDPAELDLFHCFATHPVSGLPWEVVYEGEVRRLDELLIEIRREDRVLASLEDLLPHLAQRREARTVLILITDGWLLHRPASLASEITPARVGNPSIPAGRLLDKASCNRELMRLSSLDNAVRARDLLTDANRANVSVYPVTPSGLGVFDAPINKPIRPAGRGVGALELDARRLRHRIEALKTLAENTDGLAIVNTNDLKTGMRRIVDDVSAYYLLTYYSTNTKNDGRFRRIEVKAKPANLTMKARRGYMAPTEASVESGRTRTTGPASSAAPAPAPGATEAFGALARIRVGAESFSYGVAAGGELAVVVELSATGFSSGPWAQGADVRVSAVPTAGGEAVEGQGRLEATARGAVVRLPVGTAPGPWRVTATIAAGADRLQERLEVRASPGKLVGDALIFRGTPAAASPLRAVADFQFRRTERVHLEWAPRASLDRREARLVGRDGQPLAIPVTLTERETQGKTTLVADLNLAPLAPGDYAIELVVGSGADVEGKYVAIKVIQ
jgi:VWFA-related protein